jgi:acetylornithine deacetylase/succinyl-diaminopimelate desuccinylase-like protein
MYGPGDVRVAHSADEHVPLAEVEECARVLAAWVVHELGTDEGPARPPTGRLA